MNYALSVVGALFLVFRFWLTQDKLKDEFEWRKFYISRNVNFQLCLAIICGFENPIFNQIIVITQQVNNIKSVS